MNKKTRVARKKHKKALERGKAKKKAMIAKKKTL